MSRPDRRRERHAEGQPGRIRPVRVSTVVGAVVGAMIGTAVLAGCGAGQITQTSEQVAAINGANATAGAIAVRNAQFEFDTAAHDAAIYRAGGSAPLEMSIVNTGAAADRLVAASSPVASAVEIIGDPSVPGGQVLTIEGAPATAAPAPPAGEVTVPATPTTAPTTADTATGGATGGARTASLVLTGLREDLQAGPTYPVVLTFERAGELRVDVPIGNPDTLRVDEH